MIQEPPKPGPPLLGCVPVAPRHYHFAYVLTIPWPLSPLVLALHGVHLQFPGTHNIPAPTPAPLSSPALPLAHLRGFYPFPPQASSVEQLRKDGNELFKCGDYEGALTAYTQALDLGVTPQDQAILHRNRSACYLKLVRELAALPLACGGPGFPTSLLLGPWLDIHFPRPPSPVGCHFGLRLMGDLVTVENNPDAQLVPGKDEQSLRLVFYSYRKIMTKQKSRHPKVRNMPCVELWGFCGGQRFWDHCTLTVSSFCP